jgi:hypothetical protein
VRAWLTFGGRGVASVVDDTSLGWSGVSPAVIEAIGEIVPGRAERAVEFRLIGHLIRTQIIVRNADCG